MMHSNELLIDKKVVQRLITEQFPQWAHLAIEQINSCGTDNAIYRLGNSMGIRLPRIPSAAPHIEKEYKWLPFLASYLSLTIPTPLAKGTPTEYYPFPWLIFKWINGQNAVDADINFEQAATTLAQFINELHVVDTANAPLSSRRQLVLKDQEVRAALVNLKSTIDIKSALRAWEQALAAPSNSREVWIHSDLHGGNILINNNKINAIIDFGMAGIGDPACDLMVAWTLLSAQARTVFRSIINVDDATWERGRGWALSFGLIALPYYKTTNPILAKIAQQTINEVLDT